MYKEEYYCTKDLAKHLAEDFGSFTLDDDTLANSVDYRQLCNLHRDRGAYCLKGLGTNIADELFRNAPETLYHLIMILQQLMPNEIKEKLKKLRLRACRRFLNPYQREL